LNIYISGYVSPPPPPKKMHQLSAGAERMNSKYNLMYAVARFFLVLGLLGGKRGGRRNGVTTLLGARRPNKWQRANGEFVESLLWRQVGSSWLPQYSNLMSKGFWP